ncbi:MAG TPA: hypothetical protein VK037_02610 [Pseudogracilibacillus sp.]|nr:hypothetical protein [Pseudogracilibacillus sp.]
MAKEKLGKEKKKLNPFLQILFAVILPLLVATILAIAVLMFLGVDVTGWTEEKLAKTPIISSFVKTADEKELTEKLEQAQETIKSQDELIEDLEAQIELLEAEIDDLEIDLAKLENETDESELEALQLEEDLDIKKLANSFRKMDKEQAAKIVANLNTHNAVLLLSNVSGDVRGEILEEMDPQTAATIMENMME